MSHEYSTRTRVQQRLATASRRLLTDDTRPRLQQKLPYIYIRPTGIASNPGFCRDSQLLRFTGMSETLKPVS